MSWQEMEKTELKLDEGLRLKAYRDNVQGVLTIGYGHTGKDVTEGLTITQEEADELLESDFEEAVSGAKKVCSFFDALDGPRKGAMVNLVFNMGAKTFSTFHGTLAALDEGDWDSAALHLMNSKYARQVKGRAVRLATRIRTGEYIQR